MKKLTICAIAIAALAMTMTSCKKNEATIPDSINVTVEENEILNDMKTHLVGTQLFWDEVVDRLVKGGDLDLVVHEVQLGDIVECDTVEDLKALEAKLK